MTVVFADIVGFTSLSERRDPEQVKHLVDRCFQWLTAEVVNFGGRVDKIIGDAILALFGAPVAHEDDAERAVRAALRMQEIIDERSDELGGIVRLRVGVNTGEVLVGALAAGGDYTAMGDVVNTAQRLQSAARPGEVLVGVSTKVATERVIPYEDRGVVSAKGRDDPVQAFLARSPRTAPGERPDRTVGPLIGRDAELQVLTGVATTALANDRASLLVLLGDAGMGKSRIAAEVTNALATDRGALVLPGRCLPYGEMNSWWPLADALRSLLTIEIGDPVEVVEPQVVDLVAKTMGRDASDREVGRVTSGLIQLFGFAEANDVLDPDRAREEVVRSFVTLLDALAGEHPVVLWLSDMHWADRVVRDLLETALAALARRPVVVVATARRSALQSWNPPVGRFDTLALNLEALDTAAVDALIDALLSDTSRNLLGSAARAELRERSGGNPLFLIELLALADERRDGAMQLGESLLTMPDTLRGLIAARLDNLEPAERAVLDDAAVLGRRGRVEHLSEMAAQVRGTADITGSLAAVVARDLLRVDGAVWEFTSDLTREVAYAMLTKSVRARKHLGVAQWIEAAYAQGGIDRVADVLAHHYGQAVELLDDLGTLGHLSDHDRVRALHWIEQVSARDERLRLLPNVERLCTQGLAAADDRAVQPRLVLLVRRARARAQARDAAGALEDAAAARALAIKLGDESAHAAAQVVQGEVAQQRGDLDEAQETFRAAARRYEQVGDLEGRAEALRSLGLAELFAGRTADAERTTNDALEAFRAIDRRAGEAWALQNLAWISFAQGRIAQAEEHIGASLALFDEVGDVGGSAWARGLQGFVRLAEGDMPAAEELQISVLAEAQSSGDRWASAMMLLLGAVIRLWTGRTADAVAMATQGLSLFQSVHDRFGQARIVWPLARGQAMIGEIESARRVLDEVDRDLAGEASSSGGAGTGEDHAILAVARASVEGHAGRPEAALEVMARLTGDMGFTEVADSLRGPRPRKAPRPGWWTRSAPAQGSTW